MTDPDAISIQAAPKSIADLIAPWVNSQTVCDRLFGGSVTWPVTPDTIRECLTTDARRTLNLVAIDTDTNSVIGFLRLTLDSVDSSTMRLGSLILAPNHRGQRLATPIIEHVITQVFTTTATHRLDLLVASNHKKAIRACLSAGFTREGTMRGARNFGGKRQDVDIMAIIRSDYEAQQ